MDVGQWQQVYTTINNDLLGENKANMYDRCNGLRNLINNFLNDPLVRDVFEAEETVDIDKALEYGEIIILNYALERGDSVATGFGLFFLLSYETAVLRRPGSENDRIKNFIYIDELPVLLHPKLQSFFTLFRQYRVAVICAIQTLDQVKKIQLDSIMLGNCAHQIIFGRVSTTEMDMSTAPEIPPEVPLLRRRGGVREGTVRRLRGASCRNFLYLVPLTALIMELNDKKFAVLVDADNISHRKIKDILDEIANYGTPTIKRIYGDFTNPKFAAWKEVLLENSITPIQQYAYTTGKNATDSALIIDAMDILHKEGVDGFCIVSSDSDYTRLASRIRESGREVLGFGEKKTPKPFIKSCDKFIYVEILGQTPPEKAAPAKKKADAKRSAGAEAPVGPAAETAGEKKPSPDAGHASTIIRPFDDEFRTLLENTIDDAADDSGWASLGDVGSVLSKKMPDFDPRNYGYKKLSLLVRALSDAVDMKTEQQRVYVRNRVG